MSRLESALAQYLAIRRSLGFGMLREGKLLPQFVRFLEQKGTPFITTKLALEWATQPSNCHPGNYRARLHCIRPFARYLLAVDPRTQVPPTGFLRKRHPRRIPHIYSDDQVLRLLKEAERIRSPKGLWAATLSTVFGLLAATGMRISEAINLERGDVDFKEGIVTIRHTKFGKSRLVPLHPSTRKRLRQYDVLRDRICTLPTSAIFFVSESGKRMTAKFVGKVFLRTARQAGLREPRGRAGPRLHDLRHTFAVRALLMLYRSGVDVNSCIPRLSTYLGHGRVADTYWYISATPELLRLAAMRAEAHVKDNDDENAS